MKRYVLGFMFRKDFPCDKVVLITKTHPDWQKGKLNGIGGHIEEGESPHQAMVREFREETGCFPTMWEWFCRMVFPDAIVHCFKCYSDAEVASTTDEKIGLYPIDKLPPNVIENLHWLIPMARNNEEYMTRVETKRE